MDSVDDAKTALRRTAYARRRAVDDDERTQAGLAVARSAAPLIAALPPESCVAAYPSMGTEIDTRPLLGALLDARMWLIVPRLGQGLAIGWGALPALDALHDVSAGTTDVTGVAGIAGMAGSSRVPRRPQEPTGATLGPEALREAALVIVPALMVDRDGVRLGRGGGWYDRALTARNPHARIVAVCWPWEVVSTPLPHDVHDIPVDAVLTSQGLTRCGHTHGA